MTRSSTNELFTPYKEPEREFQSSRRHFKTLSLDELRSPDFNLLSDQEYSEEEEAEAMAETMEQYMSKTRTDYGSGVARPKIDNKDQFELKGQFLKELRENTFSGSDNEDANEHIEKVLEIVDLFHVPNITVDQLMLRVFPISLTGAASHWLRKRTPADSNSIRCIGSNQYTVSTGQNSTLLYKSRQTMIPFPSCLDNYYYEEEVGNYGLKFMEAYGASHINNAIPQKEKDLGNRTMKYPKEIAENVLVGIGALMNVPIFVGTYTVMSDFAVLEDMDAYCDEEW
ncbi:hypothetical protein Tco_1272276 [Tanacetum coccineum]